jgi:predicted RNase H-like HicB family nuclease
MGIRRVWHAYCPALERVGGSTWGETQEQALKSISDVIHTIVEEFIKDGTPLPEARRTQWRPRRFHKGAPQFCRLMRQEFKAPCAVWLNV